MRLQTLTRLSQRMETLINSLLEFSRVGRVELAIGSTDLNQTVADVLESLDIRLKENRVDVRIPRPLPTVLCDRIRVAEVYRNLITNAMKYNESPQKWIEIGYLDNQVGPPILYVRDNGIGIPRRHHMAVFRIFKRLHGRDKFGGGTGAGLTIVKKVIERHHGQIWIESDVNRGTTFYFTLQGQLDRDVSYAAIHSSGRRQS
jgi:light-regulated signal transduction histidine kinase (bacteriophytochrome)